MDFTRFWRWRLQAERPAIETVVQAPRHAGTELMIVDGVVRLSIPAPVKPPVRGVQRPPAS